jgi:glutathione S-transferase
LKARAQVYRWTLFAFTELEQPLLRISRHTAIYPENKRLPADVALAKDEVLAMAAVLKAHLDGRFIAGDRITVADCGTAHLVDWANELKLIGNFPRLGAYPGTMYARPKAPQRIGRHSRQFALRDSGTSRCRSNSREQDASRVGARSCITIVPLGGHVFDRFFGAPCLP